MSQPQPASPGKPTNGAAPVVAPKLKLAVQKGRRAHPIWCHLYGTEGVGKTTFAAGAPDPIFIDAESGSYEQDVTRFVFDEATDRTTPADWTEVLAALRLLGTEPHPYKTVVVDTLDAVEAGIWTTICKRDSKSSIEDYGYGKGYVAALDEWRLFVAAVERIRATGVNVVTLAHALIKPFKNPEGDDYDRYQQKLNDRAGGLVKERADVVLFGRYESFTHRDEKTKRVRGVATGARIIHTQRTAAFDAKNRYDLPESMPLSWPDFYVAVQAHRPADPRILRLEIERKAKDLGGDVAEATVGFLGRYGDNAAALAKMNDRLNALTAARDAATEGV